MTVHLARAAGPSGAPLRQAPRSGRTTSAASRLSVVAVLVLVAAALLAPGAVTTAAPAIAVVGLLLGLPHGAVDHMVPFWSTGEAATLPRLGKVLISYLAIAAVAATALLAAPGPAVAVFFVVSALHFGRGEVSFAAERAGRRPPRAHHEVLSTLAHGAVVVALPYALWHDVSGPVLSQLAPTLVDPPAAVLEVLVVGTAVLVLAAGARLAHQRRWREAGELAVLVACFTLVTPLAAFGVYFGLWHAGRHTSRMVELAADAAPAGASPGWAARRYALHALAPTAVAVAALVLIAATDDASVLAAELAVLLALTFPHVQTVAVLDSVAARPPAAGT